MKYDAKAIGSGSEAAQSELQDKWHSVCGALLSTKQVLIVPLFAANDAS